MVDDRLRDALDNCAILHAGDTLEEQNSQTPILSNVPATAALANEETCGPVVGLEVVDTEDEAVGSAPIRKAWPIFRMSHGSTPAAANANFRYKESWAGLATGGNFQSKRYRS
jgi:hypothetical protein